MATQELTFKISADDASLRSVISNVRTSLGRTIIEVTAQAKQASKEIAAEEQQLAALMIREARAAAAARIQASRDVQREEKQLASTMVREAAAAQAVRLRDERQTAAGIAAEEKQLAATMIREARAAQAARVQAERQYAAEQRTQATAAIALQRQRSAALIAQWKSEARERERISREVQRNTDRLAAGTTRTSGGFGIAGQVGAALFGGITIAAGVNELKEAATAVVAFSGRLEQARIGFATLTGSIENANKHLKELQDFANQTPFQFEELIDSSRRLQALGFTAAEVIPILRDVGNAVSAVGGTAETLDRVTLAIAQMQSKGKVATQELNQLAEAGIPAWKILEDMFGKSRAELVKLVEDGQIASDVYIAAFRKFSQNNFGDAMEKQSHTFLGALSNIKDALLRTASEAFEPTFKQLSKEMDDFSTSIQNNSKEWQDWKSVIETAVKGLDFTVGNILRGIKQLMLDIAIAQRQLNDALEWQKNNIPGMRQATDTNSLLGTTVRTIGAAVLAPSQPGASDDIGEFAQGSVPSSGTSAKPTLQEGTAKKAKGRDPASDARRLAALGLKQTLLEMDEQERLLAESLNRRQKSFETYAAEMVVLESERHIKVIAGLTAERDAADKLRDAGQRTIQLKENENKTLEENNRHAKVKADLDEERAKIQEQITEFTKAQTKAISEARVETNKWDKAIDDLIESLAKQGAELDPAIEKQLRWNAAMQRAKERAAELVRELEDLQPLLASGGQAPGDIASREAGALPDELIAAAAGAAANAAAGLPPADATGLWKELRLAISDALAEMVKFNDFAGSALMAGFAGIKDALREAVIGYLLYGDSIGKAMKRALASILAQIAAEATIQAVLHAAYAIGRAAFGDFGGAAKHAIAAAKFAAVAVAAGVGARMIAGSPGGSGAGTASSAFHSSTSSGSKSGSSTPQSVDRDRRNYDTPQTIRVVHELALKGDAGDLFESKFIERYTGGGRLRNLVRNDRDSG